MCVYKRSDTQFVKFSTKSNYSFDAPVIKGADMTKPTPHSLLGTKLINPLLHNGHNRVRMAKISILK